MTERKAYLGDGAYYDNDGFGVTLTTENGISVQNTVYLEPVCLKALMLLLCRDYGREAIAGLLPDEPEAPL